MTLKLYRIVDVEKAVETFTAGEELRCQLEEIIRAAIRAVTVKYSVIDVRANKKRMSEEIEEEIRDDLANWGLNLVNFVLVDFQIHHEGGTRVWVKSKIKEWQKKRWGFSKKDVM